MAMVRIKATEMNQRTSLIQSGMWRNLVGSAVARVFHIMAWLLTPRHIPKVDIG